MYVTIAFGNRMLPAQTHLTRDLDSGHLGTLFKSYTLAFKGLEIILGHMASSSRNMNPCRHID